MECKARLWRGVHCAVDCRIGHAGAETLQYLVGVMSPCYLIGGSKLRAAR